MNNRNQLPADLGDDADYSETIVINRKSKKVSHVFVADPVLIEQLVDMGFDKANADTALTHTKNNLELAAEFLSASGVPEPESRSSVATPAKPAAVNPAVTSPPSATSSRSIFSMGRSTSSHSSTANTSSPSGNPPPRPEMTAEEVAIHKHNIRMKYLKEMGFEKEQSEKALAETDNDMNAALTYLLNQS